MTLTISILEAIEAERARQEAKWGREHDWGFGSCASLGVEPSVKVSVLLEEAGEVARAVLERDESALRRELVQTAAVCIAWLESLQ